MKIYNYILYDIDGNVLEDSHYEYSGDISECKGTTVEAPVPSEEETQLRREILLQLQESRQLQQEFMPFLLAQSGYKRDESGNIIKMSPEEYVGNMDPLQRQQYENLLLMQERQGKALRGELPISLQLEAGLAKQKELSETDLSRRLGSQYKQSSAGILSETALDKNAELIREQARRGEISQLYGLTGGAEQSYQGGVANRMGIIGGMVGQQSGLIPAYQSALNPYAQDRQLEYNASVQNARMKNERLTGMYNIIGTTAGIGLGGFLG